jgi:two-component system sensor kinase FixL
MANDGERDLARVAQLIVAGELVAAVAHDLRHPLTAIQMNIAATQRLLSMRADPPSTARGIDTVSEIVAALRDAVCEVERMRDALQVLEDLSRRRDPVFAPLDLASVAYETVRLVTSELSARGVAIEIIAATDVPPILADATLIRQALLELLIDAMEGTAASDRPKEPITMAIRAADARGVELVVTHYAAWDESSERPDWALALARLVSDTHGASLELGGDSVRGTTVSIVFPVRAEARDPQGI